MNTMRVILLIAVTTFSCTVQMTQEKRTSVREALEEMAKMDQIVAYIPQGVYKNYTREQWSQFRDSVNAVNKVRVEKLFNQYGFLGFDKVGQDGSHQFWLIIQHCDKYPEFQKKVIASMQKQVKKGNASPGDYAYLYDRIKINAGEKQLFGTQVTYEAQTTGRAIPKIGLADSANIDKLRIAYGLKPLKDYLNEQTASHYEMNKEHYLKMGITKAYLY